MTHTHTVRTYDLENANRLAPDDAVILSHLASVHEKLGNLKRAANLYRASLRIKEDSKVREALERVESRLQPKP